MKAINTQTPGPIRPSSRDRYIHLFATLPRGNYAIADANINDWDTQNPIISAEQAEANAALLASSYSAFDKAGRELGIDACELAESLDLAALIRAAKEVVNELDHDTLGAGTSARVLKLDHLLSRLSL